MASSTSQEASIERFREIYNAVDRVYDLYARSCGLSSAEFWCLVCIASGRSSQSEIADELAASRQTVNSAFKGLMRQNLIELEPHPQNGRIKCARLTSEGQAFVKTHLKSLDEAEESAWNAIPAKDRATMNRVLDEFRLAFSPAIDGLISSHTSD